MKPNEQSGPGKAVGLTGGMACGKSEVGRILQRLGAAVLDADDVAHELMGRGRPVFDRIVGRFGPGVVGRDGEIDRAALARLVFANDVERRALEAIVHPEVVAEMRRWRDGVVAAGGVAVGIVPLLYEAGLERLWDVVVCVTASSEAVAARLSQRGWTAEEGQARTRAQMPVEEKARRADYVIENNGSRQELENKTEALWAEISRKERTYHG